MYRPMLLLIVVVLGACKVDSPDIQCRLDSNCDRFEGGDCTLYVPTGNHWCSYSDLTCPSGRRWSDLDVGKKTDSLKRPTVGMADVVT